MDNTAMALRVEQHTTDIKELTKNVDKLAVMVEYGEKDRQQDRETMKEVARTLSTLGEKIQGLIGVEKDLAYCKEEIRGARHDIAGVSTTVNGLTPLLDRATKLEAKMEGLETLRDKMAGGVAIASIGAKVMWAIFGAAILTGIAFLLKMYFNVDVDVGGYFVQ